MASPNIAFSGCPDFIYNFFYIFYNGIIAHCEKKSRKARKRNGELCHDRLSVLWWTLKVL